MEVHFFLLYNLNLTVGKFLFLVKHNNNVLEDELESGKECETI